MLVCALAGAIWIAAWQPDESAVQDAIARLDSDSLADRESAELALATMPGLRLASLERMARELVLSPEQVLRLRQVGRRLFDGRGLAGMGVQFAGFGPDGVQIQDTIEGFEAAIKLRPLDIIQTVQGKRVSTQDDLRWEILSREPGEVLRLGVLRDGQSLTIDVALGLFEDLPNAQRPTSTDLARAFAERWERNVGDPLLDREPIGIGISVEDWAKVEAGSAEGDASLEPWPLTRDSGSRIIGFGGQARTFLSSHIALRESALLVEELSGSREHSSTIAEVVDRIRSLSRQRAVVEQRAQTLERHADTTANPDQREQFRQMRNAALQELVQIDLQLDAMREVLRQLRDDGR